jgi:hypothetical protein
VNGKSIAVKCTFIIFFLSQNLLAQKDTIAIPTLEFTNIEIGGHDQSKPFQQFYEIGYDDNVVEASFIATPNLPKLRYKYRLIQLEFDEVKPSDWIYTTKPTLKFDSLKAIVMNTVEVVAITPDNKESKPISFQFKINLPWWRTWWFWGACFISLFGLFYGRERFLKFWADEEQKHYKQVTELELRTLQLQMNPHFVFNALNAVQSFIMTHDNVSANNYLSKFAHLIRLFLDSSRSKYISLSDEIKLLSLYVEMEQLRFDGKFDFHLLVSPDVNRFVEIPTMLLQPFVENAINHGLRYREGKGILKISFFYEGKNLVCEVEDDGVGRERSREIQSKSRKGYKSQGLKITEERLNTFNTIGDADIQFSIEDKVPNPDRDPSINVGTIVRIKFPKNN